MMPPSSIPRRRGSLRERCLLVLVGSLSFFFDCILFLRDQLYQNEPVVPGEPDGHPFISPNDDDSRSPCPALNTLANHGYLPRNGRNITPTALADGLRRVYRVSLPLAYFLVYGAFLVQGQLGPVSLSDLARHTRIEHDASIAYRDTEPEEEYAPTKIDRRLCHAFLHGMGKEVDGLDLEYFAEVRVKRECESRCAHGPKWCMDALHSMIARGEAALVLGIFGETPKRSLLRIWVLDLIFGWSPDYIKESAPLDIIETWWIEQRIPEGWMPKRKTTLLEVNNVAIGLKIAMSRLRRTEPIFWSSPDTDISISTGAEMEATKGSRRYRAKFNARGKYQTAPPELSYGGSSSSSIDSELTTPTDSTSSVEINSTAHHIAQLPAYLFDSPKDFRFTTGRHTVSE